MSRGIQTPNPHISLFSTLTRRPASIPAESSMTSLLRHTAQNCSAVCCATLLLSAFCGCQSLPQTFPAGTLTTAELAALKSEDRTAEGVSESGEVPDFDLPTAVSVPAQVAAAESVPSTNPEVASPSSNSIAPEKLPSVVAAADIAQPPAASPSAASSVDDTKSALSRDSVSQTDSVSPAADSAPPMTTSATNTTPVTTAAGSSSAPVAADTPATTPDMPENSAADTRQLAQADAGTRTDTPLATLKPPGDPAVSPSSGPLQFAMKPPGALLWTTVGKTAGGRSFQVATSGEEGFHTLIIGSAVGHEPAAIQLTERLAAHLNENSLILGGFRTTLLRTLNPDGQAILKPVNGNGDNVNRGFPTSAGTDTSAGIPEVAFLLNMLADQKPQRVIHLRTIPGTRAAIGSDKSCRQLVQQVAEAAELKQFAFPKDVNQGTLEFYLASLTKTQVITLAIPAELTADAAWDQFEDVLLNLIQQYPVETPGGQQQAAGLSDR